MMVGEKTNENAMPFEQGGVVVHFGSLSLLDKRISFRRVLLTILVVFYIFCRVFTARYDLDLPLPWWGAPISAFLFLAVAWVGCENRSERKVRSKVFGRYSLLFLIPWAVFAALSFLWMVEGVAGYYHLTRPPMEFIKMLSIACLLYGLGIEYGEKAADRFFAIVSAMYLLSFAYGLINAGVDGFVAYLIDNDAAMRRYYEVHDICLAMPMFVYYYWCVNTDARCRSFKLAVAIFISVAGFKRIAIAAVIVLFFVARLIRGKGQGRNFYIDLFLQCSLFMFAVFWVFFTGTGIIEIIAKNYGIDMMSRDVVYSYMQQFASFDFWHSLGGGMGIEFCNVKLLLASGAELHNITISALHNDFLKLDIEMGLAWFLFWLIYTLFIVPALLGKSFGRNARTQYVLLTVFSFIVYATDNTTTYPVFQTVLYVILASAALCSLGSQEKTKGYCRTPSGFPMAAQAGDLKR